MVSSHGTHMSESRHTWVSHGTHMKWLSSLYMICLNGVQSCHTCEWVMAQIWISHCTNVKGVISIALDSSECCHVMSLTRMSHGTHVNESRHTYQQTISIVLNLSESCRVMSHMWMSHGTHVNGSCHTYEWVMSHMWMSHGTHVNESWYTCEWVTTDTSCHIKWVMSRMTSCQRVMPCYALVCLSACVHSLCVCVCLHHVNTHMMSYQWVLSCYAHVCLHVCVHIM